MDAPRGARIQVSIRADGDIQKSLFPLCPHEPSPLVSRPTEGKAGDYGKELYNRLLTGWCGNGYNLVNWRTRNQAAELRIQPPQRTLQKSQLPLCPQNTLGRPVPFPSTGPARAKREVYANRLPAVCGESRWHWLRLRNEDQAATTAARFGDWKTARFAMGRNAICRNMVPEPGLHSSPPAWRLFPNLLWLGVFLLVMLAGQGCGNKQSEIEDQSEKANARGLEAVSRHDDDLAITEFSEAIRLKTG